MQEDPKSEQAHADQLQADGPTAEELRLEAERREAELRAQERLEAERVERERREAEAKHDGAIDSDMARRTRRSFLVAGVAALAGFGGWEWIRTRRTDNTTPWPLRRVLEANEGLARDYFRTTRLVKEFPKSAAPKKLRINERIGMEGPVEEDWKLVVEGADIESDDPIELSMADIHKMPKRESVTELKCIEGWSQVVHWGGVRFADFAEEYPAPEDTQYVGMETPDGDYYVGLDLDSALQPQTLLAYEMNGDPLEEAHGAPLRLVIPTKYGIKNIKRVGKIFYSAGNRPKDYWQERGYDWYAGL